MKRTLSLALAAAVLMGLLAGCGGRQEDLPGPSVVTGAPMEDAGMDATEPAGTEATAPAGTEPVSGPDGDIIATEPAEAVEDGSGEVDRPGEAVDPDGVAVDGDGSDPGDTDAVAPADPDAGASGRQDALPEGGESAVGTGAVAEAADTAVAEDSVEPIQDEMVALSASTYQTWMPVASTTGVKASNNYGWIDYGNAADGYVVVCYTASTSKRLKCIVAGPAGTQYTYNLVQGAVTTLPLSDGSGNYTVSLYENVSGSKYSKNLTQSFGANLKDEFGPFLYSNQYVDYMSAPNTIATGEDLCGRAPDLLGKVGQVYSWVVSNISYDYDKARSVQSGYLPVLDDVLAKRKGICFDYAALMAGMLRCQGIPCKLVVGYAGTAYHAWISVYSPETGWIEGAVYFDGSTWHRMDPTFASSGGQSEDTMQYIGNGANYKAKYLY